MKKVCINGKEAYAMEFDTYKKPEQLEEPKRPLLFATPDRFTTTYEIGAQQVTDDGHTFRLEPDRPTMAEARGSLLQALRSHREFYGAKSWLQLKQQAHIVAAPGLLDDGAIDYEVTGLPDERPKVKHFARLASE